MFFKAVKVGIISAAALSAVGGVLLGTDLASYVGTAARSARASVKGSVPVEFQIRRARDLLDDVVPAMHADVRAIAQQEVDLDDLRQEVARSRAAIVGQTAGVAQFRDALATDRPSFDLGRVTYTRDQARDELAGRVSLVREAEAALTAKEQLLNTRERALVAAEQALDRAKLQKATLEGQVAALEGRYKLLQATGGDAGGQPFQLDDTKLAQTRRLIDDVKRQLDVSEHVMAHEATFADAAPVAASEQDVMRQANDVLAAAKK